MSRSEQSHYADLQPLRFPIMIVVGLLTHGEPPLNLPELGGDTHLVVRINGRAGSEPTPWLGFGANHNWLMDEFGDAEWYVALNTDIDLSAKQLNTLVEEADAQGYALAGPLRREPWGLQGRPTDPLPTPGYFLKATFRPSWLEGWRRAPSEFSGSMTDAAWIGGCCMAIRGDLMRELRFDERYFMYFEDADLSQRAHNLGARVGVCTTVTINHASGWRPDDPLIARRGVEYARSAMLFAEAHGYSASRMRAAALAWASLRVVAPGRSAAGQAASRAVTRGLVAPARPGISQLASVHNDRYGFRLT
jgi:hypothetical protein